MKVPATISLALVASLSACSSQLSQADALSAVMHPLSNDKARSAVTNVHLVAQSLRDQGADIQEGLLNHVDDLGFAESGLASVHVYLSTQRQDWVVVAHSEAGAGFYTSSWSDHTALAYPDSAGLDAVSVSKLVAPPSRDTVLSDPFALYIGTTQ